MRKTALTLACALLFVASFGCSNWNRMTPQPLDNAAIEQEIRKNMAADGITGIQIEIRDGVVTLIGNVGTAADRQKAYDDAAKVPGVNRVVNNISVGQ